MFRSSIRKFRSHTAVRTFSTESYENVDAMSIDKAVDMSSPALVSYLHQYGRNEHPAVTQLRKTSIAALPISKARNILEPTTNAMVTWFARAFKATRTIEIGTFTGITSLSLAFAVKENALASNLPLHTFTHTTDSTLMRPITNSFPNVTVDDLCTNLEAPLALTLDSVLHTVTDIAKPAWEEAGVLGKPLVFLHGQGEDVIRVLADSPLAGTFDMVFVDANKQGYYNYYEAAMVLLRKGGMVCLDNVLWRGSVANLDSMVVDLDDRQAAKEYKRIEALHEVNVRVHMDQRVHSMLLPIGDGLLMATKK